DDFKMPVFRPTPSIPPVMPEPSTRTNERDETEIELTSETNQAQDTKSTELKERQTDQTNTQQLHDKQESGFDNITPEIKDDAFQNEFNMRFVLIPASTFEMGSPENEKGREDDETLHTVTLTRDFYMQTTEVTQGQWKAIMGENPSYFDKCGDDCPVEKVSWNDVQAFILRLNAISKGQQYRLPTEAEWEYAARAGSKTAFANGDIQEIGCAHDPNLDKMGWYCGNSCVDYKGYNCSSCKGNCSKWGTNPVAQKQHNSWNLYDMHGNVWEWCSDYYGDYPSEHVTDPEGAKTGASRVFRGGSWSSIAWYCRSAIRLRSVPDDRFRDVGFRLVAP
ncbi:serine/threonine protein kinase, partial [Candidatus Magnetomorum sp. HK-1]